VPDITRETAEMREHSTPEPSAAAAAR
jgi:hypothetical protein